MEQYHLNDSTVVPHFDQYLGYWAMREQEFCGLAERAKSLDIGLHLQENAAQAAARAKSQRTKSLEVQKGVAVVRLHGTLMKHVSSLTGGTSTVLARQEIRRAVADSDVSAIMIHVDSPGGTAAGTHDLASEVAQANAKKPVFAYIEDLGASAAFWVASQAQQVFCNSTAMVGSIGTFGVVHDMSALAAREGVKVHVVKAGEFKGVGVPGTELTSDQLADEQRVVDQLNDEFIKGVSKGRKMSVDDVRSIADGRVHVGKAAEKLGFVDGVKTFDQAFRLLVNENSEKPKPRRRSMSEPATYEEITAACHGADAEFICDQLKNKSTVGQARDDWMAAQQLKIEEQQAELEDAKAREEEAKQSAKQAAKPKTGVEALEEQQLSSSGVEAQDYFAEWQGLVQKKVDQGATLQKATLSAAHENPQLRAQMVEEVNQGRSRQRRRA